MDEDFLDCFNDFILEKEKRAERIINSYKWQFYNKFRMNEKSSCDSLLGLSNEQRIAFNYLSNNKNTGIIFYRNSEMREDREMKVREFGI